MQLMSAPEATTWTMDMKQGRAIETKLLFVNLYRYAAILDDTDVIVKMQTISI